jgi:hypothetical protein
MEYSWSEECQKAFDRLKESLIMAPVLAFPSDNRKYHLEMDASDVVTGAVLYQQQPDGTYRPVGYSSKSYNKAKKNFMTYDKEMLAIMRALEEWRSLLIRVTEPFKILTNHHNLTYFQEPQKLTGRLS